jgi:hypothetical protein
MPLSHVRSKNIPVSSAGAYASPYLRLSRIESSYTNSCQSPKPHPWGDYDPLPWTLLLFFWFDIHRFVSMYLTTSVKA